MSLGEERGRRVAFSAVYRFRVEKRGGKVTLSAFYQIPMEEPLSGGGEFDSKIAVHFTSLFCHTVSV